LFFKKLSGGKQMYHQSDQTIKKYDIWLADLPTVPDSHVQSGMRPVIVVSNAMPMNGWDLHDGYCEGLPNMGQYFEPGAIQMRLFVLEQEYANETTARKDMATEGLLDYSRVSGELFSGY
jgi:hypothetical protein